MTFSNVLKLDAFDFYARKRLRATTPVRTTERKNEPVPLNRPII